MASVIEYPDCLLKPSLRSDRSNKQPHCQLSYHTGDWVKLSKSPTQQSSKTAQLLFSESKTTWIAKIPNHGEVVLDRSQFYC